jgi:predicted Rossmann fold nucleotide-binding protein DprA/Smf involved in DNA uptake
MPTYSETVFWLALINESGLRLNVVKPIIQRWCVVDKRALAELFELSALELSTTFGLTDHEAGQVLRTRDKLPRQAEVLTQWKAQGIETVVRTAQNYPRRLAATLPPATQPLLLWVRGVAGLLNEPGIAMLGGQEPDEATAILIKELVETLVTEGIGLVSGYGRGLDRATFEAVLNIEDGHAVAVLPMGLAAFAKTTGKLDSMVEAGRVTLVSPFSPDTAYQERLAEARNLLIDNMALALLAPQADEDSLVRASAALSRGLPIFVGLTDTTSNRTLIDQGALLLTDAGEVVEMVQQAMIDAVLLEPADERDEARPSPAPGSSSSIPPAPQTNDAANDYALHAETVEPIDSDEALEILSLGGKVPDVLRKRLKKEDEES